MSVTLAYWIAFLAYSGVVVGIGFWLWRRQRRRTRELDTRDFWSADQNLSGWSAGLSISASMMSISWSCVYGVQLFYWYGFGAAWLLIIPWLITMAGFFLLTPLFRKFKAFSQPELLERRFGARSRQMLAPALVFVFIVWAGAEIYAAGITIAPFLGIPAPHTLFLIALVVALYSFTGGFEAVVSTDKIQFVLVALFVAIMAGIGLNGAVQAENLSALWEAGLHAPKARPEAPALFSPGLAVVLMTFIAYLPAWIVETDVWIRVQAARSDAEARKGVLIAWINSFVFVGVLPLLIGLSALVLYPAVDGVIPAQLQDGALIFNALMTDFTPAWLSVPLGIGLVAAAMSTVDTCGNVVALSISYDLVEPQLRRKQKTANLNLIARWISVAAIFLAFVYALFTDSLWDIFYLSNGVLTSTVFLPVIASFWKRTTVRQVYAAIVSGFFGTFVFYFLESRGRLAGWEPDWLAATELGYIIYGLLCSVLAFGAVGVFFPGKKHSDSLP